MINYVCMPCTFEGNKNYGKYFAKALVKELIDLEHLATLMKARNLPYSTGAIKGMLEDMVDCIKEQLLAGNSVKIDDLAIFSLGIRNAEGGAESEKTFSASEHIKGIYLRSRATGDLMDKYIKTDVKFNKLSLQEVDNNTSQGGDDDDNNANSGGGTSNGGDFVG